MSRSASWVRDHGLSLTLLGLQDQQGEGQRRDRGMDEDDEQRDRREGGRNQELDQ